MALILHRISRISSFHGLFMSPQAPLDLFTPCVLDHLLGDQIEPDAESHSPGFSQNLF